jgi:hypothetical protein
MAKYGIDDFAFLVYDGIDIAAITTGFTDELENTVEAVNAGGESVVVSDFVGLQRFSAEQSGFYDSVAAEAFEDAETTEDHVVCYTIEGNVRGQHVECIAGGVKTNFARQIKRAEFAKATLKLSANTAFDHAVLIDYLRAHGAAANTDASYVDGVGASPNGGAGYIQLTALDLDGHTSLTVKLRHSDDHITFVDLASFTNLAAVGAERIAIAVNINRYTSISWAWNGAGGTPSATFLVGLNRNP